MVPELPFVMQEAENADAQEDENGSYTKVRWDEFEDCGNAHKPSRNANIEL
jgi:hypothetical protein